jgi:hypothetical protein
MGEEVGRGPVVELIAEAQLAADIKAESRYSKRHRGPPNGSQYAGGGILWNQGIYHFIDLVFILTKHAQSPGRHGFIITQPYTCTPWYLPL